MTCAMPSSPSIHSGTVPAIARTHLNAPAHGLARLKLMLRVWSERQALRGMDDRALKDLGLSRSDVERETSRSLLDLPTSRF